nr:hypothetical protein CFP56_31747 [Quercus suber]
MAANDGGREDETISTTSCSRHGSGRMVMPGGRDDAGRADDIVSSLPFRVRLLFLLDDHDHGCEQGKLVHSTEAAGSGGDDGEEEVEEGGSDGDPQTSQGRVD